MMQEQRRTDRRILILFAAAVAAVLLAAFIACYVIQSNATSSAGQASGLSQMALGEETAAFSSKSLCNSGWLEAVFSPYDLYQVKFYHGNQYNNLIISSKEWAEQVDADGNKPILQKIPDYIAAEGYDQITITPISGDGVYSAEGFSPLDSPDTGKTAGYNIIDFDIKQYEIEIDEEDYQKIEQKRADALSLGILLSDDTDQVSVKIKADGEKYKADLRLKGDWTDHLVGNQWSFRIDLSGDYCIYGMQKFSLQPIASRNGIWEYLIYEMYREQGGVTLRYDFADVFVNGVYKGVYAVEEFMSKRVIENSEKREGPIVKISEDFLWDHWAYDMDDEIFYRVADDSAGVFSEKKTVTSSTLSAYASYAITQLNKLRNGQVAVDEVLDIDLYARLHAILDIFSSQHGSSWHNVRFYYNPVTALMEPIPFDEEAFSGSGVLCDLSSYIDYFGFSDSEEYNALYQQYALALSAEYPAFIARHQEKIDQFITTIQRYDSSFSMDVNKVSDRISKMQKMLDVAVPTFELSYDYAKEAYNLRITNSNLLALHITQVQTPDGAPFTELEQTLHINSDRKIAGESSVTFTLPAEFDVAQLENARFVYHTMFSQDQVCSSAGVCVKLGFYVIGHAYGSPNGGSDGIYEAVRNYLTEMEGNPLLQFGVFTGDVVRGKEEQQYVDFISALNATRKAWYVVPGNHDVLNPEWYAAYIGQYYSYSVKENNLFICLDCVERWDIPDEQLTMIQTALAQNPDVENIFVFTHQLNWWDPDNADFTGFVTNSTAGYDADNKPNFYTKVLPLFNATTQDVYFIAGDTGAFANGCELYYKKDGRFSYIASGVGGGEKDSAIEFYIKTNGEVSARLISLNGETQDALGELSDHTWKGAQ